MIKTILIDDEPLARMVVKEHLLAFNNIEVVAECNDGFEGVKAIMQHKPDLIFLDIQMPKINGFEMLELLEQPPAVIFTTAFDEYALKAFEAHAVDYLLKPFSRDRFEKALNKWLAQRSEVKASSKVETMLDSAHLQPAQSERIVVKNAGKIKIIPVGEVHYLEAADDYVKIITKEGGHLKSKTMSYFEQVLPPKYFVRCHRSYIVALQEISKIVPYEKESYLAMLRSGAKVPVSKSGYAKLKEVLGL